MSQPKPIIASKPGLSFRFRSIREAARHFSTTPKAIRDVLAGHQKTHRGWSFRLFPDTLAS